MRPFRAVACLIIAAGTVAAGQTYTAAKVIFNHPGPYSQAQLETAAGIHPGTAFTAADLGAAAQRLVDSGYFSNAGATLGSGRYSSIPVLFDIDPIDRSQMLRVGFENFVWLSHADLEAALTAKSPLFADYLPENSPLADTFDAALVEALAAKGIKASVAHDTFEPTLQQPERALEFKVSTPAIRVTNVKLAGVAAEVAPLIQKSVNAVAKTLYDEGLDGTTTQDRILAPLRDDGYIQAKLTDLVIAPSISGNEVSVALSATLTPGDVYHVAAITFAGTPLVTADAFATGAKLHTGDVASRDLLMQTLAPVDAAYRRQGYMDVVVTATPALDPTTHQVAYTVTVKPGEQYRIHQVTTNNLDPAAKADFDRGFLMKPGELYNPDYVRDFLKNNTALRALASYAGAWKAYADPNTHTVDLVLTFTGGK